MSESPKCDDVLPGCAREFGEVKQQLDNINAKVTVACRILQGNGDPNKSLVVSVDRNTAFRRWVIRICAAAVPLGGLAVALYVAAQ